MTNTSKKDQHFLEAAAAVYAWVSAADGSPSEMEINGFISYLENLDYVDDISDHDFSSIYLSLLSNFEKDTEFGLITAKERIQKFIGNEQVSIDLIRVARKALVADGWYNDQEDEAIKEISNLLGIDESKID